MTTQTLCPRDPSDGETLDSIARQLERNGYVVVPGALAPELIDRLFLDLKAMQAAEFKPAGIGRQEDFQLNRFVRTDSICWLRGATEASRAFLDWTEQLRVGLNRRLFLGLFDYECHYASYPTGAFYKKHLDAFKGRSNRVLSTVFYLNPQWQPADGGELVIYDQSGESELERILPEYGKLVIFLSEEFPHEVLPARRERYSIAGWFRVNNTIGGVPDPSL